jgi:hypothetical protein
MLIVIGNSIFLYVILNLDLRALHVERLFTTNTVNNDVLIDYPSLYYLRHSARIRLKLLLPGRISVAF